MSDKPSPIKLSKNNFVNLKYGFLIFSSILLTATGFLLIGWFRKELLILQRISGFLLFSLMIFIILIEIRSRYYSASKSVEQYPADLNERTIDFDAIIIVHSKGFHSIGNTAGIDNLVMFFQSQRFPYRVFHCNCPSDMIAVLRDERAKYVWIFGHGWRGGVSFKESGKISDLSLCKPPKKEFVYQYLTIEIPPLPLKKFIGQFHCNPFLEEKSANIPLPQLVMSNPKEEDYYVTDDEMNHFSAWFATLLLSHNLRRKSLANAKTYERGDS